MDFSISAVTVFVRVTLELSSFSMNFHTQLILTFNTRVRIKVFMDMFQYL